MGRPSSPTLPSLGTEADNLVADLRQDAKLRAKKVPHKEEGASKISLRHTLFRVLSLNRENTLYA